MPTKIIGTAPYQVPRNSDLGTLAVQDLDSVNIQGGAVTLGASTTQGYFQNTDVSEVKPALLLDFVNSRAVDPRVTFSRSTTGAYYDGVSFSKAEENMLARSQAWTSGSWGYGAVTTVTDNSVIAPDGTMTATTFITNATTNALHYSEQSVYLKAGAVTGSIYMKAGSQNYMTLCLYSGGFGNSVSVAVDLSNGTVTKSSSFGSATGTSNSITSVGNGWYRVSVTATFPSDANIYLIFASNSVSIPTYNYQSCLEQYAGTVGSTFYVWGAQVEQRSAPSMYVPTTNTYVTNYIPTLKTASINSPRIDFDPVTKECRGLLLEEARTNVCLYSQSLSNWTKNSLAVTDNFAVAPDGTLTASKVIPSASNGMVQLTQWQSGTSANTYYTISCYAKAAGMQYINIGFVWSAGIYAGAQFDLLNGTFVRSDALTYSSAGASIIAVGNGWYRCSYTAYTTTIGLYPNVSPSNAPWTSGRTEQTITGDGFSGTLVWGVQAEAGRYPTSYIPTTSTSVTRAVDYAYVAPAQSTPYINPSAGTLIIEAYLPTTGFTENSFVGGIGGDSSNYLGLMYSNNAYFQSSPGAFGAGASQSTPGVHKAGFSWSGSTSPVCNYIVDGGQTYGTATGSGVSALTKYAGNQNIFLGYTAWDAATRKNGHIQRVVLYTSALSQAELTEITL